MYKIFDFVPKLFIFKASKKQKLPHAVSRLEDKTKPPSVYMF